MSTLHRRWIVPAPAALRVCEDPSALPFSNEREEGYENRIARVPVDELAP